MTFSFDQQYGITQGYLQIGSNVERGLDAMIIIYSLLDKHPASKACEQFIRNRTGWFTTTLTLFESKSILTKVYGVDNTLVSQKLEQFSEGPITTFGVNLDTALKAMKMADALQIDLTDAVLLYIAQEHKASCLVTDDVKLAKACEKVGIKPETPVDSAIRQQMASWEQTNLPEKGLSRVLFYIHNWLLRHNYDKIAEEFWSQSENGSRLP
jgi:predicted nucleic acid-binding protein